MVFDLLHTQVGLAYRKKTAVLLHEIVMNLTNCCLLITVFFLQKIHQSLNGNILLRDIMLDTIGFDPLFKIPGDPVIEAGLFRRRFRRRLDLGYLLNGCAGRVVPDLIGERAQLFFVIIHNYKLGTFAENYKCSLKHLNNIPNEYLYN
jgi:hypothetical protein